MAESSSAVSVHCSVSMFSRMRLRLTAPGIAITRSPRCGPAMAGLEGLAATLRRCQAASGK